MTVYTSKTYNEILSSLPDKNRESEVDTSIDMAGPWEKKEVVFYKATKGFISENAWVQALQNIYTHLKREGVVLDLIVHGSMGDGNFTNFSDIEITLYLEDDVIFNAKENKKIARALEKINRFIVTFDPLQHHGPFLLWPDLVRNYNEEILPLSAYDGSWSFGGGAVEFRIVDSQGLESKWKFMTTLTKVKEPGVPFFRYGVNPFTIKRFLSNFFILPAFYYQSLNHMLSKPDALERFSYEFGGKVEEAIKVCSHVRRDWPKTPAWLGFVRARFAGTKVPSGRLDYIVSSLYRDRDLERRVRGEVIPVVQEACICIRERAIVDHF